ncbi:MAG: hypothetical protein K6T28_02950 [Acidothermus sp.]|nr:hypothetical protein [Acidothermus sp.]
MTVGSTLLHEGRPWYRLREVLAIEQALQTSATLREYETTRTPLRRR